MVLQMLLILSSDCSKFICLCRVCVEEFQRSQIHIRSDNFPWCCCRSMQAHKGSKDTRQCRRIQLQQLWNHPCRNIVLRCIRRCSRNRNSICKALSRRSKYFAISFQRGKKRIIKQLKHFSWKFNGKGIVNVITCSQATVGLGLALYPGGQTQL